MKKIIIEEFEVLLWATYWHNKDNKEIYNFLPSKYDNEKFTDFKFCLLLKDDREFKVGYKIYEENNKPILQILDEKFQIKIINKESSPNTMILIDENNAEIQFEGHSDKIKP